MQLSDGTSGKQPEVCSFLLGPISGSNISTAGGSINHTKPVGFQKPQRKDSTSKPRSIPASSSPPEFRDTSRNSPHSVSAFKAPERHPVPPGSVLLDRESKKNILSASLVLPLTVPSNLRDKAVSGTRGAIAPVSHERFALAILPAQALTPPCHGPRPVTNKHPAISPRPRHVLRGPGSSAVTPCARR